MHTDSFGLHYMKEITGNSILFGKYTGKVYSRHLKDETFMVSIDLLFEKIKLYCYHESVLKLIDDGAAFYFVDNGWYNTKELLQDPKILNRIQEIENIYKSILIII